ncbi:MAG: PIN domain-containing protein [Bryobacteraceae bacterium]
MPGDPARALAVIDELAHYENVLSLHKAWATYDAFYQDRRIRYAEEPQQLESLWRDMTQHPKGGPNFWTDAYLAAFALGAGLTVVTFDKGFQKFKGLRVHLLNAA